MTNLTRKEGCTELGGLDEARALIEGHVMQETDLGKQKVTGMVLKALEPATFGQMTTAAVNQLIGKVRLAMKKASPLFIYHLPPPVNRAPTQINPTAPFQRNVPQHQPRMIDETPAGDVQLTGDSILRAIYYHDIVRKVFIIAPLFKPYSYTDSIETEGDSYITKVSYVDLY